MQDSDKKPVKHSEVAPEVYDRILDRLRRNIDEAGESTWESLQETIQEAIELEMAAEGNLPKAPPSDLNSHSRPYSRVDGTHRFRPIPSSYLPQSP